MTLSTSKQIKLIEAVSYMAGTLGKLRDQGIAKSELPEELLLLRAMLHDTYEKLTRDLSEQGQAFLASSGLKVRVSNPEECHRIETKLFDIGFCYLNGGNIVQTPSAGADVMGIRVNKRGHMTPYIKGEDDRFFDMDLSREVSTEEVLKARKHDDI